ncbi:MAG: ParM/StbA family protein [Lachnospiraceae bacterium]|jgi:plasmid segregation protein ParM|nr:ParM/StbA family protein [Lachnospiraceae bacterium]
MDTKTIAIGIDHGWSHIKTRNSCFVSGVGELGNEPMVYDNILEYNGKYYRIGGDRLKVQDNKVCNDNYYLLTLAAVAKELKFRGLKEAHIVLAVGLPIGRFGAEKKDFINYLSKNRMVRFRYEKTQYLVTIEKVLVYPQCYGAVVDRLPQMAGQEYVVDIGSWTIDYMKIIDMAPDESNSGSDPNGIITCMRKIDEVCVRKTNSKIDEYMIREVMIKGDANLDSEYIEIIKSEIERYTKSIFRIIAEKGINVKTTPITFVGGGAGLMKRYAGISQRNISYIEDVRANAIGYETLATLYLKNRKIA